jgi:arabinosyltransferase C
VAAPLRRPQGSLALANVRWLTGHSTCGLADDIQVLADRDILTPATPGGKSAGFTALGGFSPNSPPPDPPGSGMSTYLWGSRTAGSPVAASITTAWFTLPPLGPAEGLSMSLSGKANTLVFEFGHDNATTRLDGNVDDAVTMGEVATPSPAPPGEDPDHPSWRAVGIDAEQIPVGANRVRIRAIAAGDKGDWLAFTGPRRHTAVGLSEFLAAHGPVLVSWPQSFLFPCVHNISQVADGLAQTPRTLITAPGPWLTEPTDQTLGGDFAGLNPYGRLYEVPTRMASHPGIYWGTLLISGQADARDAYSIRTTSVPRPGHGDRRRLYQTDLP